MEVRNLADEGPKNLTWNNDSINITGHTSQINAISQLGSDPDQWLLALRGLEELENGPRKRKLLQHFFSQSGKILDSSELRRSRSYAVLLGKEALHYAEIDAEDARHIFQMGLLKCQRVPVLYVMFAQFELDHGRKEKALKILQHGQVCVENASEIVAAKTKLERGCKRIDGSKEKQIELPLKNITNRTTEQTSAFVKRNADIPDENKMNTQRPVRLSAPISTQSGHGHFPSKEQIEKSRFSFPSNMSKPSMSHLGHLTPVLENVSAIQTTTEVATSNCKFQTPPLHRSTQLCKTLDLGLTLDSPASPDLSNFTFDLTNQSKTEVNSETVSNARPEVQSMSTTNMLETASKSSVPSSLTCSEKKFSPVSRMRQMTSQTTGKKPARVPPSTAPRRVLLKGGKSQWSDSDSDDDVRPLQKSPDDENGTPQAAQSKENQSAINYALTEKSLPPSRPPAHEKENQMPLDVPKVEENVSVPNRQPTRPSAFKCYPKSGELIPPTTSVSAKNPESHLVPSKHVSTQQEIHSHHRNFHGAPIEAPKTHQIQNDTQNAVNNAQLRSCNPSDSSTASTNLGARNTAPPVKPIIAAHSWAPPPEPERYPREEARSVHPAVQLLKEKKMIEVNGNPYILLKLLGKGGSSKVYQVLNLKTSEISALKQVNLMGCENSVLEGYKNEINFLKKLQGNQYIIKLIDYEIREQHLYLLMECGSLDLSAFLKKKKALNENLGMWSILVFWENMLRAVEAIHKHGVIHLDLKPANFMLIDYTLKLIDFGIANSIQVDATSIIKDTQFGTLNYMAPETINDLSGGIQTGSTYAPKFKVGPKADVWSLGCILYYIMYGKTPFQHIHHQTMKLFAITNDNHRIEFPDFPRRELVEIVQACLIRDPKKRPSVEMLLNHPLLK